MLAALLEEGMTIWSASGQPLVVEAVEVLENPDRIAVLLMGFDARYEQEYRWDENVQITSTLFEERFSREAEKSWRRNQK
jgi:hypothetical protein